MTGHQPLRVLFLCTGNSARSQMAEAILRHLGKGAIEVESAGTRPQPEIHPMARDAVRKLLDSDMAGQYPKAIDRFVKQRFDYVITVCDHAAETCPVFPGGAHRIHWSFEDPAAIGSDEKRQGAFDDTARRLLSQIRQWLSWPETQAALTRGTASHGTSQAPRN
jgi:protein-tyrosine-phosphatase